MPKIYDYFAGNVHQSKFQAGQNVNEIEIDIKTPQLKNRSKADVKFNNFLLSVAIERLSSLRTLHSSHLMD
jgi:hypothetical protein